MRIQIKKHKAQCMLYAFAMVLDTDANTLIDILGHDGTEIVFPNYKEPQCYRGFHPAEMVHACHTLNYWCVGVPFDIYIGRSDAEIISLPRPYDLSSLLKHHNGVLLSAGHAYAWDKQGKVIDPDDGTIEYRSANIISGMEMYTMFYIVERIAQSKEVLV